MRIAITNQKGGSCKTTAAVNLSAALAENGTRVLLVDLDPQDAGASTWLGVREQGSEFREALTSEGDLFPLIVSTAREGLDVLPSSPWLAKVEADLSGTFGAEYILRERLEALPNRWDVTIIDAPPTQGLLSFAGLCAADKALLAVEASSMAIEGLAESSRLLTAVKRRVNQDLELLGVLLSRVDRRLRVSQDIREHIAGSFGDALLSTSIPYDVRLLEAPSHRQDIFSYAPGCKAAAAFRQLAEEILERVGGSWEVAA